MTRATRGARAGAGRRRRPRVSNVRTPSAVAGLSRCASRSRQAFGTSTTDGSLGDLERVMQLVAERGHLRQLRPPAGQLDHQDSDGCSTADSSADLAVHRARPVRRRGAGVDDDVETPPADRSVRGSPAIAPRRRVDEGRRPAFPAEDAATSAWAHTRAGAAVNASRNIGSARTARRSAHA